MALKGNLRDFSTTQLLNLVNLARKTGKLALERKGEKASMSFKAGKLVHASVGDQGGHLAQMLFKNGKLTQQQSKAILAKAANAKDKELGLMLINAGYVTRQDIVQSVRQHTLDVVYRLFTWEEGMFRFEANQLPPESRITVPINLENVIMEGSRRLKEWERLQDELPNLDVALRFTDRPDARLRNINLSVEEWRVISYINPRNTMRQIAQANKMSDFQIRRIIYGMLQAGLVELVRPQGAPAVAEAAPSKQRGVRTRASQRRAPQVQRSVVKRLIGRIKRL